VKPVRVHISKLIHDRLNGDTDALIAKVHRYMVESVHKQDGYEDGPFMSMMGDPDNKEQTYFLTGDDSTSDRVEVYVRAGSFVIQGHFPDDHRIPAFRGKAIMMPEREEHPDNDLFREVAGGTA